MVSVSVRYGLFVFPPEKTLISLEKALCDWPIVLQYDVKVKYRPIKSLYFRSFVVSVLFLRYHFKVIRKSLYLVERLLKRVFASIELQI